MQRKYAHRARIGQLGLTLSCNTFVPSRRIGGRAPRSWSIAHL